jgi:hypothetical protein
MATKAKCLEQAYVRNPHKESVGGINMTALRGLMTEKKIGIKTITEFEDFTEVLGSGLESVDILYFLQCKVRRMRKNLQYKIYFQDNQAPIHYWCFSKKATKPTSD